MQNVIILGATSGIAQPLERMMAAQGKSLLLVGRSQERLDTLAADLTSRGAAQVLTCVADLSDVSQHRGLLQFARERFPDLDTLVLAYGTLLDQEQCQVSPERTGQPRATRAARTWQSGKPTTLVKQPSTYLTRLRPRPCTA
jgi:short-subunit dehydrogenase